MGNPQFDMSLDRINNNEGYSKDNCKWSTRSEQMSNRRCMNSLGRIGVTFCQSTGKYSVQLRVNKKDIWLVRHSSFEEACDIIEKAEMEHLGYSRSEY